MLSVATDAGKLIFGPHYREWVMCMHWRSPCCEAPRSGAVSFPPACAGHASLRIGTLCCDRRYNYFIVKHGVNTLFPYKLPEVIVSNATNAANITNVTFTETFDLVRACGCQPSRATLQEGQLDRCCISTAAAPAGQLCKGWMRSCLLCTSRKLCLLMTRDRLLQLQLLAVRFGC